MADRRRPGIPPNPLALVDAGLSGKIVGGYAKRIAFGEVRQALLSWWMFLAENHLALGAVQRLPGPHPALQGASRPRGKVAMATQHLAEDGDRPQTGHCLQHGDNLTVPDRRQRIGLRRPCGVCFWVGNRGSASSRAPVVVLRAALAAAASRVWVRRKSMYNLTC